MGAETDLWDDSALIRAFDNAMAKYKAMNKVIYQGEPSEEEAITSSAEECEPIVADECIRDSDVKEKHVETTLAENMAPSCDANVALPAQERQVKLELHPQESDFQTLMAPEATAEYSSQELDYSQLVNQYYVLEEQRQKVLQQLYQVNVENPQASSNMAWNSSCYASEPDPAQSQSSSSMSSLPSCYPYCTCPCPGATFSVPPCVLGGQCVSTNPPSAPSHPRQEVKIAMEKVVSSTKTKPYSESSNLSGDTKKESSHVMSEAKPLQNVGADMDMGLLDALNAWYTAGFYTAKYLTEQCAKKGPV